MARKASSKPGSGSPSTATIGFEAKLWLTAGKLRNNMDAAEQERNGDSQPQAARRASEAKKYKHVILGLNFLKYISDTFEEHRAKLLPGFILANGRMSSKLFGEGDILRTLIDDDLVDTALRDSTSRQREATPQVLSKAKNNMVALPGQLFYSTQIPVHPPYV